MTDDPPQVREWRRQNNVIYGGLIAIGVVLVQPFLTAGHLDTAAMICVVAFSAAIPLLAALVLITHQEDFQGRGTRSLVRDTTQVVAEVCSFVGVVAGFWHITWVAGVVVLGSGLVAVAVHSLAYPRGVRSPCPPARRRGQRGPAASRSPRGTPPTRRRRTRTGR